MNELSELKLAVTVDLDSTLCDTSHRHSMIPVDPDERSRYDWSLYAAACSGDAPFRAAVELVRILARSYEIIIVSGRSGASRELTEQWLLKHDVPFSQILLDEGRYIGAHSSYKIRRLRELQEQGYTIVLHLDDYPSVRFEVERELNIPTLIITPGYDDATSINPVSVR